MLPKVGVFNTSVFKNVAYGLKVRGVPARSIKDKVLGALDFVGMIPKKDQQALTLSSGETQRLGLARALVVEPEVLFLDEPTASIDPQNTTVIEEIILKLRREARTLVIMATHDMEQVKRITDRVIRVEQGRIVVLNRRTRQWKFAYCCTGVVKASPVSQAPVRSFQSFWTAVMVCAVSSTVKST